MSNDKMLSDKDIDNIWGSVKSISSDTDKEGIHKINKNKDKNKEENKEEKLKYGKECIEGDVNNGIEGDVNNGIEGRTKEEIQTKGVVERSYRIR